MTPAELVARLERRRDDAAAVGATAPVDRVVAVLIEELRELQFEPSENGNGARPDRLLRVAAAAVCCGMSSRWIYKHADSLPFVTRFPTGALRCSEAKLTKWLERRR